MKIRAGFVRAPLAEVLSWTESFHLLGPIHRPFNVHIEGDDIVFQVLYDEDLVGVHARAMARWEEAVSKAEAADEGTSRHFYNGGHMGLESLKRAKPILHGPSMQVFKFDTETVSVNTVYRTCLGTVTTATGDMYVFFWDSPSGSFLGLW